MLACPLRLVLAIPAATKVLDACASPAGLEQPSTSFLKGGIPLDTFFTWLGAQIERQDEIGTFARYAIKDRIFPRRARHLHLFLLRYEHMPEQRASAKLAHREWRRARKQVV